MLMKSFSTLAFESILQAGSQTMVDVEQNIQNNGEVSSINRKETLKDIGLNYRREAVSKFFCIHD